MVYWERWDNQIGSWVPKTEFAGGGLSTRFLPLTQQQKVHVSIQAEADSIQINNPIPAGLNSQNFWKALKRW